jgi:hypothetical protein
MISAMPDEAHEPPAALGAEAGDADLSSTPRRHLRSPDVHGHHAVAAL